MTELRDRLQSTLGTAYTLDRELGGGGMSRVFVAEETSLGRKVVVKVLSPELAAGISVDRFKREIQMAARLQQANIVPVLTAGETDGLPYYTMPLAEGMSLRERLRTQGALTMREAVNVIRDMCRALAYAHKNGIVHRDIKPENVLLSEGTAVVTDFGIAKAVAASREEGRISGGTLTQAGTSLGTPAYMAPEQVAGDPAVDHRSDIYALGCVAYELFAGRPPFADLPPHRLLAAHLTEKPRPVEELRADVPAGLAALVMRCLEKDPALRPQSAVELLEGLEGAVSNASSELSSAPAILMQRRISLTRALSLYAAAALAVPIVARAAVIAIGLPDWVFPGSIAVMALGLPVILATHFVQRTARKIAATSPTFTPGGSPSQSTLGAIAVKASPHLTWRRAAIGGFAAVGGFILLVGGYMALRAMGIGPAGSLMAAGVLGTRERLIVADFKSPASDTTLGGVVTEAFRADLAQSRNLEVVQALSMREALQRMQRPVTSRVDFTLAREVATREGVKAVLDGEVLSLGGRYVITAKLIATQSGEVLGNFREEADASSEIIPAIGRLARNVRSKVGESLKFVQSAPALEQVTTSSLEALRKYVAGSHAADVEVNYARSMELLREAVALDSTFAMAWRKLGIISSNAGMPTPQIDSAMSAAYRYRDRLSYVERQMAISGYYITVRNDRQRAIEALEELIAADSMNSAAYNNLALYLRNRREFARAEELYQKRVDRWAPIQQSFAGLLLAQLAQGKLAAAESTQRRWMRELPSPNATAAAVNVLYARGDVDSARRVARGYSNHQNAQLRANALSWESGLALIHGQLREGKRLSGQARAVNRARGAAAGGTALSDSLSDINLDGWFLEQNDQVIRRIDAMLERYPLTGIQPIQRPYLAIARVLARAGRPDRARLMLSAHDAAITDSTERRARNSERLVTLGEVLSAERRYAEAIASFRQADQAPDGPANECTVCLAALLAPAYDLAGKPDSAIALFEAFLNTPAPIRVTVQGLDPLRLAGTHKRLGELYEAKGDRAKALDHYLRFVELWKNADPELQPKVREVRARIERLRNTERL